MPARRGLLRGALAAAAASTMKLSAVQAQQAEVRWSAGTELPKTKAPANATDCHFHIYDSSFPIAPYATLKPPPASVDDYHALAASDRHHTLCGHPAFNLWHGQLALPGPVAAAWR
jgi:hypothetical protein